MQLVQLAERVRRALGKPPHVLVRRLISEARAELDRLSAPERARLPIRRLSKLLDAPSISELWSYLASRPYPALTRAINPAGNAGLCAGDRQTILATADRAMRHEVDLLGSGPVDLGNKIDWHRDFKSGFDWPPRYFRDIDYGNPERRSDVKVPWELSRLQWLIPVGQAYLITEDERYAETVRTVIDDWIEQNPYARSVNWTCTMEAALRILTWTWFFHVFHGSQAWAETDFRERFLRALFLHVEFTERHLEYSDVNGNHCTADAAGLVFGGLFFGRGKKAERWQRKGWRLLAGELPRQVFPDGVDFEASVAYHRLVLELFLLPAIYRLRLGLPVDESYRSRLCDMARFSAAYSRADGTVPLWGDADDARALPFGCQPLNDHRYLSGMVGLAFDERELIDLASGPLSEAFWLFGPEGASRLKSVSQRPLKSQAFGEGGFFVMRGDRDHVFIDCGPIGLAGRGGHGHNDCLAFEAMLDGVHLISDCGAYVYTESYAERNAFRSTAYHNTPQIDGAEINRFIQPDYLWNLHNDAQPRLITWDADEEFTIFAGSHTGYLKLQPSVTPTRIILLDHVLHSLIIFDEFDGQGKHAAEVPLHLARSVDAIVEAKGAVRLTAAGTKFRLLWSTPQDYSLRIGPARMSPRYGKVVPITRLSWTSQRADLPSLLVCVMPATVKLSEIVMRATERVENVPGTNWRLLWTELAAIGPKFGDINVE